MSIKTTPTTEISLNTTEVVADAATEIKASGEHLVKTEKLETVKAIRKEYSIVGDAFYAGINSDQAPWWLNDLVDSTVNGAVKAGFSNYDELTQDVRDAIDSIDIAKNTFVQSIDFTDRVNGIVGSKLETLNATYDGKFATIVGLNLVEANTDYAITQRINDLKASFSADINSRITNVQNAFSDADQSLADDITTLTTAFLDQEKNLSGTANAVSGLQTFVGLDPDSALPNGLGMLSRLNVLEKQTDGVIEYTTGTYDVMEGIEDPNTNTDNDHLRVDALPYVLWTHLKGTGAPTSTTRPYTNYSLETPAEERANVLENTIYIRQDYTNSDEDRYYLFVAGAWESITEAVFQRERLSLRSAHTADVYIQYSVSPDGVKTYNRGYKFIKTAPDTTSPYSTDSDGFGWAIILDTDTQNAYMSALNAQDLADSKRRVFVDTPFPPYDEGDLWVDTSGRVSLIKVSQNTIGVNGVFTATHWVLADEYAKSFVENTYEPDSAQLHRQLDGKLEYYFYEDFSDISGAKDEASALAIVSGAWNTSELKDTHNGDVVYFKNTKNAFWYQASTGSWLAVDDTSMYQALQDAADAQASADGKVSSFYAWGDMEGGLPPSSYTTPSKDATYKRDKNGNYLDSAGSITTNPESYVEEPAGPAEVVSADNVTMWFSGGKLYKKGTTWEDKVPVPTISGNGTFIAEGDVLTVFDPTLGDTENYQYVNGVWVINGPTGIISKSKWFVDLDNAVNGKNGHLAVSLNNLSVTGEAYTDGKVSGVENKFRYDSNILLDGKLYASGFGLSSEGISQAGLDGNTDETAFDSEFWVNAKRFVLKNPDHPGVEARFKVTGSGISLGVEHTEATKNVPAGAYSSGGRYVAGDIVTHNGTSYMAIKNVPRNTSVSNTSYWQLLAGKGDSGKGVDFWFKRSTITPTDTPSTAGVDANGWYTDLSNPILSGAGDLYTVKGTKLEGSNVWSFSEPTIHLKKYLRELTIYSAPTTGTVSAPARSFYNFDSDKLTIGSNANGWTSSLKNIQANHQKIYVTTALVSGNSTETAVPITWSGPTVYAQRTDGISPDALTVSVKTGKDTTTLNFSDGSSATISNGADGESSGVVIVYADNATGTNASFTQGSRKYANYYEWAGTAPTKVPSGLTYTLFVGTDGDSAGVLPIYADDITGTNATFTYRGQEFVNFYDWTVKAPASVPPGLTYVRFVGIHYTGTTEYYKLTNSATAPTVASGSWSTSPQSPTASNKYLWNYNKNSKSDGSYTNSPVTLITSYVKDGKEGNGISSITEEYKLGSSPTTAPTGTWSSTFSGAGTMSNSLPYMWNRTTIAYTLAASKVTTTLIAAKGDTGDNAYTNLTRSAEEWVLGRSGSQGSFSQNGPASHNIVISHEGPDGVIEPVWKSEGIEAQSGPSGGWNKAIQVDPNKTYRYSVWMKEDSNEQHNVYLGCSSCKNLNGDANSNPYFYVGNLPTKNKWYLVVGYLHSASKADSTPSGMTGVYDPETGGMVYTGSEFKQNSGQTAQTQRVFRFYAKNDAAAYFTRPRVEEVNGEEMSLGALMGRIPKDGSSGLNNATVYLYRRFSGSVTDMTATTTYNFDTKTLSGQNNSWSQAVPNGTDPLYIIAATASSTDNVDTISANEWSAPQLLSRSGDDGDHGLNSATVFIYKKGSTSLPTATTTYNFTSRTLSGLNNGWGLLIPDSSDGSIIYVSTASAASTSNTDTIPASEWATAKKFIQKGDKGESGLNNATVYLYRRFAGTVTDITSTTTYDFTTKKLTGQNNGWSQTIPSGDDPLYVIIATASDLGNTDTIYANEWTVPQLLAKSGSNGEDGLNSAAVFLYRKGATGLPTSTSTYTFSTGKLVGHNNSWSQLVPDGSDGTTIYVTTATAVSTSNTDTIPASEWATAKVFVKKGDTGERGPAGSDGQAGAGFYGSTYSSISWSTSTANSRFTSLVGRSPVKGDIFTQTRTDGTDSQARQFNGSSWGTVALQVNGSIVADGTIAGQKFNSATTFTAGSGNDSVTLDGTGRSHVFYTGTRAATAKTSISKDGKLKVVDGEFSGQLDVKSSTSGGRLEIVGDAIKVFDTSGNLRVTLGRLN